jgi:hypothetical protein
LKKKGRQFMNTAALLDDIEKSLVVDIDVGRCTELNTQTMKDVLSFFRDTAEILIYRDISVLDVLWLCQFIIGPLLAPDHFPYHLKFEGHDGQAKLSEIETVLKEKVDQKMAVLMDADTVVPLVEYLDLCFKVEGKQDVYLFPAHLPYANPREMWMKDERMKVYIGRRVQCVGDTSIVSPGTFNFFQCMAYAELGKIRVAKAWRDGIILRKEGAQGCSVECLCTIPKHLGQVDFIARSGEGRQSECLSLLEIVKDLWSKAVYWHSRGTKYQIWYLSKGHIENHEEIPAAYSKNEIDRAKEIGPLAMVRTKHNDIEIEECLRGLAVDVHVWEKSEVLEKVQSIAATRWYPLGIALGYTNDRIDTLTHNKVHNADKLLALFTEVAEQIGRKPAEKKLLDACSEITPPIFIQVTTRDDH